MAERALNVATKKRLINNEPFVYAHLIKYERPRKIPKTSSIVNTDAARYGYLSDAAFNISFDDGTSDVNGNSNGAQIYYADKVSGVGGFSESADPKATGMTLTVSAESLFNFVTRSDITMTASGSIITVPNTNLAEEGFREGDKILITGGTNSGKTAVITGIKTNGTVLTVDKVLKPTSADTDIFENSTIADQSSGTSITLKIDTDENASFSYGPIPKGDYYYRIDADGDKWFDLNESVTVDDETTNITLAFGVPATVDVTLHLVSPVNPTTQEPLFDVFMQLIHDHCRFGRKPLQLAVISQNRFSRNVI